MKKAFLLLLTPYIIACSSNDIDITKETIKKEETAIHKIKETSPNTQVDMTIEGMTCEIGCVRTVRSHLSKMEGVSLINIDFDSERDQDFAKVQFDSEQTSQEAIKEEIESIAQGIYTVTTNDLVNFDTTLLNE